jgi:hypothetical protein
MESAATGHASTLATIRGFWSMHVDALERHLDRLTQAPRRKGKKR